ncbi:MAG: ferredoxin [Bacteroidetes bacterium]|nr:ferredoxin [Bacteroidota bacterium]
MNKESTRQQMSRPLDGRPLILWRIAQVVLTVAGAGIFLALLFFPNIGLTAFWDVLIPIAPALFVLAAGVWRNICPLGTVSLLPRHIGLSKSRRLPLKWQGRLHLGGVVLLFLVVPLRHLMLNNDGTATALILAVVASAAFLSGVFFEWKSGWCSGLCPVHPVEKLYGEKVLVSAPNAHCGACQNCCIPCPDTTSGMNRLHTNQRIASLLLAGGLPGFIWGWFHVPDCRGEAAWQECIMAFGLPWASLAVSLALFWALRRFLPKKHETLILSIFAAFSVSCYYWYRIPALVGYGLFPSDGLLVDLTGVLPFQFVVLMQVVAVAFFGWWLVVRRPEPQAWQVRPPFAKK